jgi:hypothetical protein
MLFQRKSPPNDSRYFILDGPGLQPGMRYAAAMALRDEQARPRLGAEEATDLPVCLRYARPCDGSVSIFGNRNE